MPVSVRHSNSRSGNPVGPATTASMAVRFYLPDGTTTDLVPLTAPLFFTRTPEETLGFLQAVRPEPATGQPVPDKVTTFLASRPWVAHAVQLARSLPASVSFAQTAFHMLHAFRFVNEAGDATYARYHWEPEAGVAGQTLEESQKQSPSYLFDEYELRLQRVRSGSNWLCSSQETATSWMIRMHRGRTIDRGFVSGSSRLHDRRPTKSLAMPS